LAPVFFSKARTASATTDLAAPADKIWSSAAWAAGSAVSVAADAKAAAPSRRMAMTMLFIVSSRMMASCASRRRAVPRL
jgi:hypothetical protein